MATPLAATSSLATDAQALAKRRAVFITRQQLSRTLREARVNHVDFDVTATDVLWEMAHLAFSRSPKLLKAKVEGLKMLGKYFQLLNETVTVRGLPGSAAEIADVVRAELARAMGQPIEAEVVSRGTLPEGDTSAVDVQLVASVEDSEAESDKSYYVSTESGQAELWFRFKELYRAWREQRGAMSSTTQAALCPAYQSIIGMGAAAVPLIFAQLESEGNDPDQWFWALKAILGVDPVKEEDRGNYARMAESWLAWAKNAGYAW